jgi:transcriptional regulator with XRE-family HTH domain
VTGEQIEFGSRLRQQRERRQVSLSSVADLTKINKSLLASLESGDASHWPRGIYRRAFLREYAAAIGLPSEPIIAEFRDLFPEGGDVGPRWTPPHATEELRLTFAPERRWSTHSPAIRVGAAIADGALVIAGSAAISMVLHVSVGSVIAILALIYYSVATASQGGSLALSIVNAGFWSRPDLSGSGNRLFARSRERRLQSSQPDRAAPAFVENARSVS